MMLALGVLLYFRLRAFLPSPTPAAAPLAVALGCIATWSWRRVGLARRSRWARALRGPDATVLRQAAGVLVAPLTGLVRGARDVLEGDAALLWALVVVVVAFLLLRGVG